MDIPMTNQDKQGRALRALQVAAKTGFIGNVRSTQTSCLSLCNICHEHIPVGRLLIGAGVPPTIIAIVCPGVHPAETKPISRVKPYRSAPRIVWTFDDSPRYGRSVVKGGVCWRVAETETEEAERERRRVDPCGIGYRANVHVDINTVRWPEGTKDIALSRFNRSFDAVLLPASLERLWFGSPTAFSSMTVRVEDIFNRPLDGLTFPAGLREIFLGDSFDQPIEGVNWPVGLERLSMPGFDQSIANVQWPPGLKSLEFVSPSTIKLCWEGKDFDHDDDGIYFQSRVFDHPIVTNANPGHGKFNRPLASTLPPSLETLWLSESFDQPLDSVSWPPGIATLGLAFDFHDYRSEWQVRWPSNLRDLYMANTRKINEELYYPRGSKVTILNVHQEGLFYPLGVDFYARGEDPNIDCRRDE